MDTLKTVRIVAILGALASIGTMVGFAIAKNDVVAVTAGLCAAAFSLGLLLATFLASRLLTSITDESAAANLERQIQLLIESGTSETELRQLVKDALSAGKGQAAQ